MAYHQPFQVTGFHSCDRKTGLDVLNGNIELNYSNNRWDWLGKGIYFWEQNPLRALEYAFDSAHGNQFNRIQIKTPFVLGAIIELGNCLNLVEPQSLSVLKEAYNEMERLYKIAGRIMPVNKGDNRVLDCSVIKLVHQSRKEAGQQPYDTIRCAFAEGEEVYPGASFSSKGHIQTCVLNNELISVFFTSSNKHIQPLSEKRVYSD